MPFDQFTIEQLAGDLLPTPTKDQLIATAFHRNSLTNGEGGANHEEYRNASVIDRVNTTWETWQATTISCVQCHNHPYDPIRQTDFYRSFALFNNTSDRNLREDYPVLKEFKEAEEEKLEELMSWIAKYGSESKAQEFELLIRTHEPKIVGTDFHQSLHTKFLNRVGDDFTVVYDTSVIGIMGIEVQHVDRMYLNYRNPGTTGSIRIHLNDAEGPMIATAVLEKTGWPYQILSIPVETDAKAGDLFLSFHSDDSDFHAFIEGLVLAPPLPGKDAAGYEEMQRLMDELMRTKAQVSTPIMLEKTTSFRRTTHLFERGNWLMPGEEVLPGIPTTLNPGQQDINSRLTFAQWLMSEENPLTARVIVNRIWAQIFGKGIVPTLEDFGTMGEQPTHPELLDWLALEFSGPQAWSLKQLVKSMVLSATYRQSSRVSPQALETDPDNAWLARSSRIRLSAEQLRDQALLVSGLLSNKMYGPE